MTRAPGVVRRRSMSFWIVRLRRSTAVIGWPQVRWRSRCWLPTRKPDAEDLLAGTGTNPGRTVSNRPEDRVGRMGTTASCKTCGTELRAGARFCDACGSPIAPSHELAEFKQVTVLFADVVHSMGIASAVGADEVPGRLSDHLHPHRGAKRHLMTAARRTHPVAPPQIPDLPADLDAALRRLKLGTIRRSAPEVLLTAKTQRWTKVRS